MPKRRRVAPGSHEEREILLKRVGFTREKKAILLSAALDAVTAGLASPDLAERLRAAGMAFGVLGTKPSRNPMAASGSTPTPGDAGDPEWMSEATEAAPSMLAGLGSPVLIPAPPVDPGDAWGEEAGEAGF